MQEKLMFGGLHTEMTEMKKSIRFFLLRFFTNAADASAPKDWGQYFFSITGEGKHHGLLN